MRKTNKVIEIIDYVSVSKIITGERISRYNVDLNNKTIEVNVELMDDKVSVLKSESYVFTGDDFVKDVTESKLWEMIDKSRNELDENK